MAAISLKSSDWMNGGCRCGKTLPGVEPEGRHHGCSWSRQPGRDHAGEGMRCLAVTPRPRHCDARKLTDVAHPIIDAGDIAHAGAGGFGNGFGMVVDDIRLQLALEAK